MLLKSRFLQGTLGVQCRVAVAYHGSLETRLDPASVPQIRWGVDLWDALGVRVGVVLLLPALWWLKEPRVLPDRPEETEGRAWHEAK